MMKGEKRARLRRETVKRFVDALVIRLHAARDICNKNTGELSGSSNDTVELTYPE